ncbi:competence type IV pilus major pilin ComGC [Planococcus kocurii]|uniref:competence type IV pilus major pilin ComGC n=1 Tax=Planococcus kocurii TaxID=1374 RepID=UPI000B04AB20|nr:hypothetical protein [Planococcus kocurii]
MMSITVLIATAIPKVTKQSSAVDEKGCEAFVQMVQGQVESYQLDLKVISTLLDFLDEISRMDDCF